MFYSFLSDRAQVAYRSRALADAVVVVILILAEIESLHVPLVLVTNVSTADSRLFQQKCIMLRPETVVKYESPRLGNFAGTSATCAVRGQSRWGASGVERTSEKTGERGGLL